MKPAEMHLAIRRLRQALRAWPGGIVGHRAARDGAVAQEIIGTQVGLAVVRADRLPDLDRIAAAFR